MLQKSTSLAIRLQELGIDADENALFEKYMHEDGWQARIKASQPQTQRHVPERNCGSLTRFAALPDKEIIKLYYNRTGFLDRTVLCNAQKAYDLAAPSSDLKTDLLIRFASGVDISFVGYSETNYLIRTALLQDIFEKCLKVQGVSEMKKCPPHGILTTGQMAQCRQNFWVTEGQCSGGARDFSWKSFNSLDHKTERRISDRWFAGRSQVLIFSVGPHHFASYPGHNYKYYYNASLIDEKPEWILDWYKSIDVLTSRLAALQDGRTCVLWKSNNIGHCSNKVCEAHPSAEYNANHILDRIAVEMATQKNISVIDVSRLTRCQNVANSDFYHGYDHEVLAQTVATAILDHCTFHALV